MENIQQFDMLREIVTIALIGFFLFEAVYFLAPEQLSFQQEVQEKLDAFVEPVTGRVGISLVTKDSDTMKGAIFLFATLVVFYLGFFYGGGKGKN